MRKRRYLIAFCCAAALLACVLIRWLWPHPAPLYTVTILPELSGGVAEPWAINDREQVVGVVRMSKGDPHLFLWDRVSGMQDLGPVAYDRVQINNAGQIAATVWGPNRHSRAFLWDPASGRHILPTLGGAHATAGAINNLGQVVGGAQTAAGIRHAFVWDEVNGIRDLTPSSAEKTRAFSINDSAQVVVVKGTGPLLVNTAGTASTSQTPPLGMARHVNNAGDVVGLSWTNRPKVDVVLWHPDSGPRTVVTLKRGIPGIPKINNAGQVHYYENRSLRLFGRIRGGIRVRNYIWDAGKGSIGLEGRVSLAGGSHLQVMDLNNNGCLVGLVHAGDARSYGVLFEPIAEAWSE